MRGDVGPVTTCTNVAPLWVQGQKVQPLRRRDCIERSLRVQAPAGGGVCDVVGDDDGIGRQPPVFLKLFLFVLWNKT